MQCSCGGQMKSGQAARSKQRAVLEFQECRSCGRRHVDALLIGDQLVASGEAARRQFEAFDSSAPADPKPARKDELDWRSTSEPPPRHQIIRVDYLTGGYCVGHGGFFGGVWDLIARWALCRSDEGLAPAPWPSTTPLVGTPFDVDAAPAPEMAPEISPPLPIPTADLPPVGGNFSFDF